MIPKIIHYCWFGRQPKPQLMVDCMQSWAAYLPDYQLMEWNEGNYDLQSNAFVSQAYAEKKWAFVSDYVRADVLHAFGGIYLDTDVEIKQSLERFLVHGAFSGFEREGFPFTALWGAEKGHLWPKKVLEYYQAQRGFEQKTNTLIVTDLLVSEFRVDPIKDQIQYLEQNIVIYPSWFFCLDLDRNFATHHFNGSWIAADTSYKSILSKSYYRRKYLEQTSGQLLNDLYQSHAINASDVFRFAVQLVSKKIRSTFRLKNSQSF